MSESIDVNFVKVKQEQEEVPLDEDISCDMDIGPIKIEPGSNILTTGQEEKQLPAAVAK